MLHELSHNVFNEHDAKFHALWDQLREEYEGLIRKGYTGEGFLSDGKRLGGKRVPRDEARRIARNAAEKRRTLYSGSGQKLGGAPLRPGEDIRRVIVEAIDRRARVLKGCGSGEKDAKEIKAITDQAMSTGFKTKAEEDEANDQAIAQALWEMVQEEEREKYGDAYIPPSAANPTGNGGRDVASAVQPLAKTTPTTTSTAKSSTLTRPTSSQPRHVSRLVAQPPPNARSSTRPSDRPTVSQKPSLQAAAQPSKVIPEEMWECEVCTCHNPMTYLCCDACGTERSVDFHGEVPGASATCSRTLPNPLTSSTTWTCHKCSTVMENQWWTCSTCSSMKLSS